MPTTPGRTQGTTTTAAQRRRTAATAPSGAIRVYGEVGLTVAIGEDPYSYVKVMFGHERIAPDDSRATLRRVTKEIDAYNEEVVSRQVQKYAELAAELAADK